MENNLKLSKELYRKEEIVKAIEAFHDLVSVKVIQERDYYLCRFQNSRYPLEETKKEFENYIIDLMNSERKIN